MEEVEIVAVADARDVAVEVPAAEEGGFEVFDCGDAAEVGFVEAEEGEGCGCCEEADCDCLRG